MSRSLNTAAPAARIINTTATVAQGGTGATTKAQAIANLGAIATSKLGQPSGLAQLDGSGKLPVAQLPGGVVAGPTLDGGSVYTNQNAIFTITNYDANTTYAISVSAGTVSRIGATITYAAPSTAQNVTMTINGRTVSFAVKAPVPAKPTITSPVNGSVGLSQSVLVTASVYAMTYGPANYKSTDWQVALDSAFVNVVQSSYNDSTNKTAWLVSGLQPNNTYYVRVRYQDQFQGFGAWSDAISFTTSSATYPVYEEAKLTAPDRAASDYFGRAVAVDQTGTRIAVGARGKAVDANTGAGAVYIFIRGTSSNTWSMEQKLTASDAASGDQFGAEMSIDATGTRVAISSPSNSNGGAATSSGAVYVFTRYGTTWSQEVKLAAGDKAATGVFGNAVNISYDGTRIAVGANRAGSDSSDYGYCYVFSRTGTTWTQEAKLIPLEGSISLSNFGAKIEFDKTMTRLAVTAPGMSAGSLTYAGAVYIFVRIGTSWTCEAKLQNTAPAASERMGQGLGINLDCSYLVACSSAANSSTGCAYVFVRSGTSWIQQAKLTASDGATGDQFGIHCVMNQAGDQFYVGAYMNVSAKPGAVYVFTRSGSNWAQVKKFVASDGANSDNYGVRLDCTWQNDRLVVGSYLNSPSGITNAGAVYVYR